jgi:hypothetical protein
MRDQMQRFASVVAGVSIFLCSGAHAAPEPATGSEASIRGDSQRSVGVGAEIGFSTGLGVALHLGTRQFGVYTAVGILPVFITGNQNDGSHSITFDVYRAYAWNADLYWMFYAASPRADVGISAGYSANSLLGNGGNVGVAVRYDLAAKLALTVFGGLTVFPDAGDHLTAHGYPATQSASLPELQGGVNAGLVFYP